MNEGDTVTRITDGQRGIVVLQDGELLVQVDRGARRTFEPAISSAWRVDAERPALTKHQVGRIQWEALKALKEARGEYGVQDWRKLRDNDRLGFVERPPVEREQRLVWEAIGMALGVSK